MSDATNLVMAAAVASTLFPSGIIAYDTDSSGARRTILTGKYATTTSQSIYITPTVMAAASATLSTCDSPVNSLVNMTFNVRMALDWGNEAYIRGNLPELGDWNFTSAKHLVPKSYTDADPLWSIWLLLPAGTDLSYQYLKLLRDDVGNACWYTDAQTITHTVSKDCGTDTVDDQWPVGDVLSAIAAATLMPISTDPIVQVSSTTSASSPTPLMSYSTELPALMSSVAANPADVATTSTPAPTVLGTKFMDATKGKAVVATVVIVAVIMLGLFGL